MMNVASVQPAPNQRARNRDWLLLSLILLLTLLLYLGCLPKEFTNWDDPKYILENPLIRSFSLRNLNRIATEPYFANYAPLTLLSYALDYRLWRLNANAFHVHNVLLHLGCAVFWFMLLRHLQLPRFVQFLAVGLFAIHPANVESICWASERKTLLASFFFLISFYCFILYEEKNSRRHYLCAILMFLLSLLSKASTVVAPLLFLAYEYCLRGKSFRELKFYDKLPFLILAEIAGFWTVYSASIDGALNSYHTGGLLLSLLAIGHILFKYVLLILWPWHLSGYYLPTTVPSWGELGLWLQLLMSVLIALLLWRHSKSLFFWLSFSVIFLLPVLNIVPLPIMFSSRYLYIPLVGFLVFIASCLDKGLTATKRFPLARSVLLGLLIVWTAFLCFQTVQFSRAWRNSVTFWTDVIEKDFKVDKAHYNLGHWFLVHGMTNRAGLEFALALSINERNADAMGELGGYYYRKGFPDKALRLLYSSLDLNPDLALACNNLGAIYFERGDANRSRFMFLRATYIDPRNLEAFNNLVVYYLRANRLSDALEVAQQMMKMNPERADGYFRMGQCLAAIGDLRNAMEIWSRGLLLADPADPLRKAIEKRMATAPQRSSDHP